MRTYTAETWVHGMPDEVLELLTEPDAISRWAPIAFEVLELTADRLRAGAQARVRGTLAGRRLEFDVQINQAHRGRLSLVATGPISIDADYVLRPADGGSALRASVSVSGRGLIGGMLARAAETLLAAGALTASVSRIRREAELSVSA